MRNNLLFALGTVLIIVPEPITTVIGAILLFNLLSPQKHGRFVNSSGVIVRNGSLPLLRAGVA